LEQEIKNIKDEASKKDEAVKLNEEKLKEELNNVEAKSL